MDIIRPMQLSFNQRVLEQDRRFYFTVSAALGINLADNKEQIDAVFLKDAFEGNPDEPPLLDVGYPKPCGEFLVSGHFHSPGRVPVRGGEVRARVGEIEKTLYVFGPRQWQNGFPTEPEKVTSLPLTYKNAFGGEGYELNPGGKGFKDNLLPLVEYPRSLVGSQADTPVPACFSVLDTMDPRRMQYKGTYGPDYKEKYFPGHPEDMDWKMFLTAPEDQRQDGYFKGDETYVLENMHPDLPRIEGQLPKLFARCFIKQKTDRGSTFGELPLHLDTLWFFPEKLLGMLIFRGVIEVADDEAETVTHMLGAYESLSREPRSLSHYETALEKRIHSDDFLAKLLTTSDLIPEGHKCAMEVLFEMGGEEKTQESPMAKNAKAKADAMQKMADEKVEEAVQDAEKQTAEIDLPDEAWEKIPEDARARMPGEKGGLNIREMMGKKPDPEPDPEIDELYQKMDAILPGITTGDPGKMDLKHFSFEKMSRVSDATREFAEKKKKQTLEQVAKDLETAKDDAKSQLAELDSQIEHLREAREKTGKDLSDQIGQLESAKEKITENLDRMMPVDPDEAKPQPLPRLDAPAILAQLEEVPPFPPELMDAIQHLQAQKIVGMADETTRKLEQDVLAAKEKYRLHTENMKKMTEERLAAAEEKFKKGYLFGAHHMADGLSPHKEPVETVREAFLAAVSDTADVSGGDWACLDLAGRDLAGIDLRNAYLEQVNFNGANLEGANLSNSILARADLSGANLSGANLSGANIGSVLALDTNFSGADMTSAKLSKGNFTGARFNGTRMESIEALDLVLDRADFSTVSIATTFFINAAMTGTGWQKADMELCMFINARMADVDFSDTVFNRCSFIDSVLKNVRYDGCDLSNCVFVASDPEKSRMENMRFRGAKFFQANLMNMGLSGSDFSGADLEKAFFWNADLSGANLSRTRAVSAQFRKAKLTGANLDKINLYQGSVAKAHLVDASFKGANLCQADFLRSTITNTDFSGANLDLTLIEKWRPK